VGNRISYTLDSRTSTTTTAYLSNTADLVVSSTDPGNRLTSFAYDSRGRQASVTLPDTTFSLTSYTPRKWGQ
jgi:YD repeat-containing protein